MKIRLYTHKSFRHYGGREITTKMHTCEARLVRTQDDHLRYVCELLEPCGAYRVGHLIAVPEKDYNVS